MPYRLKFSDKGKPYTILVPDMSPGINTVDTSLALVGKGYPNYGEKIAENFLYLLENFASPISPINPIEGQLWYDTSDSDNKVLRVLDGTNWPSVSGIYQQYTDPKLETNSGLKGGDIWVDTSKNQLKIYNSSGGWTTVGPSTSTDTGAFVATLPSLAGGTYDVILNKVDGKVISVVTKDAFTPLRYPPGMETSEFPSLIPGTNLAIGSILNGTALSAQNLTVNGVRQPSSKFLIKNGSDEIITGTVRFETPIDSRGADGRDGVVIVKSGDSRSNYIQFYKNANDAVVVNNTPSGKIIFKTAGSLGSMHIENSMVKVNLDTPATSTSTGALVVAGGIAVGGNLYVGKKLYVNEFNLNNATLSLSNTSASVSTTTGALLVSGGVGIGGGLTVGGRIYSQSFISSARFIAALESISAGTYIAARSAEISGTYSSVSTTTGAVTVVGGVGIGGKLYVGGLANNTSSYIVYYNKSTGEFGYGANSGSGGGGSQGATGTQGGTGTQGAAGTAQGTAGTQGATGTQGTAGAGTQGAAGTATAQGAAGTQGATGTQGTAGAGTQGTSGPTSFTQITTASIVRSVDAKLKEIYVTPEDFGAVGNGITDDTAAIQAALDTGKSVHLSDGKLYFITTSTTSTALGTVISPGVGLRIATNNQRFGGPGMIWAVGNIEAVKVTGDCSGVELDLTFNSPYLSGTAVVVDFANRVSIRKIYGVNIGLEVGGSVLYVRQCNQCTVDWIWATAGGAQFTNNIYNYPSGTGITWYGSSAQRNTRGGLPAIDRSDILHINFAVINCGGYGLNWDGNCNSLSCSNLGLIATKGVIIQNTSGGSPPGIARFTDLEIDYPTRHGVEILVGLDYDFSIPYIQGAGILYDEWLKNGENYTIIYPGSTNWTAIGASNNNVGTTFTKSGTTGNSIAGGGFAKVTGTAYSGIKVSSDIIDYQVRLQGGKYIGNTGYGIENAGGVVYSDGTMDLSANQLGRISGKVWSGVTPICTIGTLPPGVRGMRAFVTDASNSNFYDSVAGGGSLTVPVFYDGSNWLIG